MKTIIVTGGAGFIGSALVRYLMNETDHRVINIDKLTYAGNLSTLESIADNDRYVFVEADICDQQKMTEVFAQYDPCFIMHLAAESHVDRSIDNAAQFIQTNIVGTYSLLEVARAHWLNLNESRKNAFRFHHVSTDEVFGDLENNDSLFTESTAYQPNSPYAASKASSDHLVRAWHRTYGLPIVITNCSNNYGPYHFPEKLIPLVTLNAIEGKKLPIYGNGEQVRDWLYVEDHVKALYQVVTKGAIGETYNIGGHNEIKNIDVVKGICQLLDELVIEKPAGIACFEELITFVEDRPGHDVRYAIDASKIQKQLGWLPDEKFTTGLRKTVKWYLSHLDWCHQIQQQNYNRERLGINK